MPRSDRSEDESEPELPYGAQRISEADYFRKSEEFRVWLKREKSKYFDELSGEKARSYFRKFVKAWNRGKLSRSLYAGLDPASASSETHTRHKWNFKNTRADDEALRAVREQVGSANRASSSSSRPAGRVQGPAMPSSSDLVYAREVTREAEEEERSLKRKRDKAETRDRVEDMVGPKEVGREGMLEKKRAKREADRSFRERGDEGLEVDERTLFGSGGGDSFKAQYGIPGRLLLILTATIPRIARRDAAKQRAEAAREEKAAASRERFTAMQQRNDATMAMFQALAKERFG
ncbi:hypothetical protein MKEN_01264800 [Mycena kentingensis (nom. inval.)]|nr:hypothetical protein MKEN_01264800 [Mycena kentingensis (nom. inval.)]